MRIFFLPLIIIAVAFSFGFGVIESTTGVVVAQEGTPPAEKGMCTPTIFENPDTGRKGIDCDTATTCCVYEIKAGTDGSYRIWCDCTPGGQESECCHMVLMAFPKDPDRTSFGERAGHCMMPDCGDGGYTCRYTNDETQVYCQFLGA